MLTIKNRAGWGLVHGRPPMPSRGISRLGFLLSLALLSGCTPSGERALLEGKRLIDRGKYPQAVQKLEKATSLIGSTNALAWNYLGLACQYARRG